VPLGTPVKFNVTSYDVLHSFYLPAFRIKVDAVNGMTNYAWFLPDRLGSFFFQCAELCGEGHADMTGTLRIVTQEEYEKWLQSGY
jgi:heme/copper-type cytochrome/quinol oxidase subunit 2